MDVLPCGALAAMVDQVYLEVARLLLVPGESLRGDLLGQGVAWTRCWTRQAWFILSDPFETSLDGGEADAIQLIQQHWGDGHLAVIGQVLSQPRQVPHQALGANVVDAL
jgi:hypothetical protein